MNSKRIGSKVRRAFKSSWITASGDIIPIAEMDMYHLINAKKAMIKQGKEILNLPEGNTFFDTCVMRIKLRGVSLDKVLRARFVQYKEISNEIKRRQLQCG